jgi:hypothetical protein
MPATVTQLGADDRCNDAALSARMLQRAKAPHTALAGYYATFGLSGLTMTSDPWRQVFAVVGAVVIGLTAWARLAASSPGGPSGHGRPALS